MSDEETKTLDRPAADRATVTTPHGTAQPTWLGPVLIVGIVLAALNLRPAITSLGALFEETRTGLGMSGTVAGLITSVPALCFAVFGVTAPRLSRRFGPVAVVCAGMAAVAAGLLIRPFADGAAGFLAASALSLAGIALTNVLLPVIVKRYFPDRVGTMTGLYSMALAAGTSLAAAATVPLTDALGGSWRTGLLMWASLAVLAVLLWLPIARAARRADRAAAAAAGSGASAAVRADAGPRVARSRTAWALACYFGLQATGAYITMGWLPQIFRDAGVSASTAGVLLAVTMVMGVPLAFVIPGLAGRMRNQGAIAVTLGVFGLTGYLGLYFAPAAGAWAWALLLGVSNCAFPLVITMIGLRAKSPAGVVKLSAFAQSTGYLISIPGPLVIGTLYQHSGGWDLPLALMAGLLVPQIALGVLAGRDRTIEDECGVRD
ncbi:MULTISPECIES: CynX/NimT family MFS transporter [Streptomyces]|uniref:MFS transporter n=1 Tax=Streptomyces virginiae TaxID=1961 RepID=A0ABQ3NIY7_STRVG|nr:MULTISPECIES: MFS transporter [Streptomyces]GLV96207.1 MFS transporter [Streptomyces lavendulae subsp. lavendulae]KOU19348.1 transporter [Streptomyces sp. WM6349]KOU86286.1 transporter [Streptomyces sp. XY593]KOU92175.1 transporter [Streptomyces sp. XY533]KOU95642.1 transporter [Streptomyces sp. XY511]